MQRESPVCGDTFGLLSVRMVSWPNKEDSVVLHVGDLGDWMPCYYRLRISYEGENMSEEKGVVQVQEVADLLLAVVKGVKAVKADGKVDLADLGQLVALAPSLIAAVDKIDEVPAELKDLSEAEATALAGHLVAGLALEDAHARVVVEKGLAALVAVHALVKAVKA